MILDHSNPNLQIRSETQEITSEFKMNLLFDKSEHRNKSAIISEEMNIDQLELSKLVNSTAAWYLELGIKPSDRVAILSQNSVEYVISIYALWRINSIPIPLNIRLTQEELKQVIDLAGCKLILKSAEYSEFLKERPSFPLKIKFEEKNVSYKNLTDKNDTALIIFTSGSSGEPKGVELTNGNLYASYLSISNEYSFSPSDKFLATLPFYHIGGFSIITRTLLSGGTLIIPKSLKHTSISKSLKNYDPSVISLVPTMLKRLVENEAYPNKNLRLAFIGGGPSDNELVLRAFELGWPFVKVYGSTETCSMISGVNGKKLREKPASGGKAFVNVEIRIFDQSLNVQAIEKIGEIGVKSESIAKGYLNNKDLWNQKIKDGFYLTNDFGYMDREGYLFVVSRRIDLIISGGENIDPAEVEKHLLSNPAVEEAIVFPIENNEWGQIPAAVLVLKKGVELNKEELISKLKNHLASYKVPQKVFFINELPRNEIGKIDLTKIRAQISLD